jgi:hypothetical protein
MKKFEFMVGKWSGDALWFVRTGTLGLIATEDVRYEQNGLMLRIEGRAKNKLDGKPQLTAITVISYDDQSGTYRIREDLSHLEGTLKVDEDWRGMTYEFSPPRLTTRTVLRINEQDYWTETHWLTTGSEPPAIFLQMAVRKQ